MKNTNIPNTISYQDSGVDIEAGNRLVDRIKPWAKRTHRKEMLAGIGGFNALFEVPVDRYRQPVLVSGTDGVGTKLKLALALNKHDTIGIDLVAMCVNDIVVCGAEPLFFLDYYATGKLSVDIAEQVIKGIASGCEMAGMALVGGETAEMPGFYQDEEYDLAGFAVGVVEKSEIIDGSQVMEGDAIIGLCSSGAHSNGYSLIRKILEVKQIDLDEEVDGKPLGDILLAPTRIYVKTILALAKQCQIKAIAHITGGGLLENIPRVLPKQLGANINLKSWQRPALFDWLQQQGNVTDTEMWRTFNNGIGMIIVVKQEELEKTIAVLQTLNETAYHIGNIVNATTDRVSMRHG